MNNTITVIIPFSFKGIEHTPSLIIDLDTFVESNQNLDNIFHLVATENNIGNFSYEYEVLESSPQVFKDPTGIAGEFLSANIFDLDGFKQKLNDDNAMNIINDIALERLNIDNLKENKDIKQALLDAYKAGKESS